jgi:uncharacterized protein YacL
MRSFFSKRISMPESWFGALLFAFKLLTVLLVTLLFVWHETLPPNHTDYHTGARDMVWYSASYDFFMVAVQVSLLYFLAAAVLVIGGLVQLVKYSRKAAIWTLAFGILALIIGIMLAVFVSPPPGIEILRSAA